MSVYLLDFRVRYPSNGMSSEPLRMDRTLYSRGGVPPSCPRDTRVTSLRMGFLSREIPVHGPPFPGKFREIPREIPEGTTL